MNLLNLKGKLNVFINRILYFLLEKKSYNLVCFCIKPSIKKLNNYGNKNVLCLSRSIFYEDIKQISRKSEKFIYLYFPSHILQKILEIVCEENNVHLNNLNEINFSDEKFKGLREDFNKQTKLFFFTLSRFIKFDAIVAGQFGYLRYRGVPSACQEMRIPFYVIYKEGIVGKSQYGRYIQEISKYSFEGSFISFYTQKIQNIFINHCQGVTSTNSNFIGVPRFDIYYEWKKTATLFFFTHITKFFEYSELWSEGKEQSFNSPMMKKIEQKTIEYFQAISKFFNENSDFNLIIKFKQSPLEQNFYRDKIKNLFHQKNIEITDSEPASMLIKKSNFIFCFNSTVLLESLAMDRIVISPDYSNIIGNSEFEIIDRNLKNSKINYTNSFGEIQRILRDDDSESSGYLTNYVGYADCGSSARFESSLEECLSNYEINKD